MAYGIVNIPFKTDGGISEAPNDGHLYGRKNSSWSSILNATSSYAGLLSAEDKSHLDELYAKANALVTPTQSGSLTYTGNELTPTWNNYNRNRMIIGGVTSGTNAGIYTVEFTPVSGIYWADTETTETREVNWVIDKASGGVSLSKDSISLDNSTTSDTIIVTRNGDGTISVESSDTSVVTVSISGTEVIATAVSNGSATITIGVSEGTNHLAPNNVSVRVTVEMYKIYGAEWDGTATTSWTRTNDAANFVDPVPYVSGASSYGSPFDDILPWSGMKRVTDSVAGELVSIPKFWYNLEQSGNGLKIQIANEAVPGFHVSPAHMDRGDGKGERSVVYIGRYKCASDTYKSTSGATPAMGEKATFPLTKSKIESLGSGIFRRDFALLFTIYLLYLVEFADWNSQVKIGYGCQGSSMGITVGYTDTMPYHTGTTLTSRKTYGQGIQYRYIEGPWENSYEWVEGIYSNATDVLLVINPNEFANLTLSSPSGGTSIFPSHSSSGYVSAFSVSDKVFPLFYPTAWGGSDSTYSCDSSSFGRKNLWWLCSWPGSQNLNAGMFDLSGHGVGDTTVYGDRGARLMKLP